jgi:hypothetical protein
MTTEYQYRSPAERFKLTEQELLLEHTRCRDFFTVTAVGFGRLYVFVVLEHGRRRVVHWATTAYPTLAWVLQQLREATLFGRQPRYLFRDNDRMEDCITVTFQSQHETAEARTRSGAEVVR